MNKKSVIIFFSLVLISAAIYYATKTYTHTKKELSNNEKIIANFVPPKIEKDSSGLNCTGILLQPTGFVNDFEYILSSKEKNQLDSIIKAYEKQTTNQIAILTIDSLMLGNCTIVEYSLQVARNWGVGQKGKNNGILIALSKSLTKIRIQNGIGISKIFSDAETKKIIDEIMIPPFKKGNYFDGVKKGLQAIMKKIGTIN